MLCPVCRVGETRVVDSRDDESAVRRRRECLACRQRFTTYERIEAARLFIVKKDGRREPFSRDKVLAGLRRACEKRPVSEDTMQEIAESVSRELHARGDNEYPSTLIGELLMDALKKLDKVAYIRFASVYRSFEDLSSFQAEIAELAGSGE